MQGNLSIFAYNSRFGKGGQPTDRIKAYTWHDAIEYVKYNYFEKKSVKD